MDFAHARNGYVYHTRYDNMDFIPLATFQHTGDNILALVKHLASSPVLEDTASYSKGRMVFYDILGLYIVAYSETIGYIINLGTVLLSLYSVFQGSQMSYSGKVRIN